MPTLVRLLLLKLVILQTAFLFAQEAALRSPEVTADGRATLRLRDPHAKQVLLESDALPKSVAMQRDRQGVWSATIGPLAPDDYSYTFEADGVRLLDPGNPAINPNLLHPSNRLHIAGPQPQLWELQDVPHGVVHHHFYRSAVVGQASDFYVYTPPGYEKGSQPYPVLYLLHGFTDDASGWTALGKANVIFDNLIAQGKVRPMVIVMPLGYGQPALLPVGLHSPQSHALWMENLRRFRDLLLQEVMPQVEAEYRVSRERDGRAIAGLSMGGAQSLYIGLNAPQPFAWIGGFSSAVEFFDFATDFPKPVAGEDSGLRLLWIGCGENDHLFKANRRFVRDLQSQGRKPVLVETPGAHTWLVWRRYLIQLLPQLFASGPG